MKVGGQTTTTSEGCGRSKKPGLKFAMGENQAGGQIGSIGVGMAVAGHPSLQTGRAQLRHPAFQLVGSDIEASRIRGGGVPD
jgi:hypothetical protein